MRKAPAVAPTDLRNAGVGCLPGQLMVALVMVFTAGPILSLTLGENVPYLWVDRVLRTAAWHWRSLPS